MKTFIESFDNAISSEHCELIIDYMNQSHDLRPGLTMGGVEPKIKDSFDIIMNLDELNQVNQIITNALCECIEEYTKKHQQLNYIQRWECYSGYNLQKYKPNQGYHQTHCENMSRNTSSRILAWMFYLNTLIDDGGTHFDNYDITMNAVQGRCLIWPAYWTHFHHGVVSKTETKYIATGWIHFIDNV